MKKLGGLLDLLLKLKQVWPIVLVVVSVILTVILGLADIGRTTIQLTLPLPVLVFILALALYAPVKLVEWLANKNRVPLFEYAGLLWQPSLFRFKYPTPIYPIKDCGCEVTCKIYQPSYAYVHGRPSGHELDPTFTYSCPVHGELSQCPNEDIAFLQIDAQKIQNRVRSKSKK